MSPDSASEDSASEPDSKNDCRAAYQGDAALARLLRKHGVERAVASVRDLVAGVAAAPEAEDRTGWTRLVTAQPSAALTAQLRALEASLRASAFERAAHGPSHGARLAALRAELARRGLAGFIVPRGDEHQGEYVPPSAERLAWLTGFTGSAGAAIVLGDKAALFVDGRYTLQAHAQVDGALYAQRHLVETPPWTWLKANVTSGAAIGYDPWLHSANERLHYAATLDEMGAKLVACETNPLDAVWTDRPPPPLAPVVVHGIEYAGVPSQEKRAALASRLREQGVDAAVLTAPDSIAWLLNIRGGDVPHTPLPLSFALLHRDGRVALFCDPRKIAPGTSDHLGNDVTVAPRAEFAPALDRLGKTHAKVMADPATCAAYVIDRLEAAGAEVKRAADPVALPKACKNAVELAGARAAHVRDGAALTRFLAWIKRHGPSGEVGEIAASDRLHEMRRAGDRFRDLSFATISGAGSNGAIVHYRAMPETERKLGAGELYLVDSGAQYLDGTTDVTRTLAIGAPSDEMRDRFTRVLKGHIALALARFPDGTSGSQLDALARASLWQAGLDYDHGTGHGVGSYLGVHEGPQRISKAGNMVALRPGMIVSNEPGYYKTGAYGIRIENLVAVVPVEAASCKAGTAERALLGFETLTLAPIDLDLIEPALLTRDEIAWLDAYHARVRATLTPLVDGATAVWLEEATAAIVGM